MATDCASHHTLIVPLETEVAGTALRTAPTTVLVFARCPFCDQLASTERCSDGILHPVLQCDVTGRLFSVVFETPKRGYGGMQPLPEPRHRRFRWPDVSMPAIDAWAEAPLQGYTIRAQCPFCGGSAPVAIERGGDLGPAIRCEGTGKTFGVYFPPESSGGNSIRARAS